MTDHRPLRILLATSELHPYSKSGGLADMTGSLAKQLARTGHQVGVVCPLYRGIRTRFPDLKPLDWHMRLPLGNDWVQATVWTHQSQRNLTVYFIDQPAFFDRPHLYQEAQTDYPDNSRRFIFFSKAVVHLARYLPWHPEMLHLHDWQTGLVPLLTLHQKLSEGWGSPPATCMTIHNLAFQGRFPAADYRLTNLPPDYFNLHGAEFHGTLNCLKAGLCYADLLTTVSPRYAREITTPGLGFGLDPILRVRQKDLAGILNGVDYEEWNTTRNPYLAAPYDVRQMAGKAVNKRALQEECRLPQRPEVPLFANVSRLTEQKGIGLMIGALEEMLAADLQFVQLGTGDPTFENALRNLAVRFPTKVFTRIGFDTAFSHRVEAGADFFLMPSSYEPCGLNQMYSLRYGTIPIVRTTGGLDDSVIDITEDKEKANGIKFLQFSVGPLAKAIRKAIELHRHPDLLARYRRNGMQSDFSWAATARQYLRVYRRTLGGRA